MPPVVVASAATFLEFSVALGARVAVCGGWRVADGAVAVLRLLAVGCLGCLARACDDLPIDPSAVHTLHRRVRVLLSVHPHHTIAQWQLHTRVQRHHSHTDVTEVREYVTQVCSRH